ncbi:acyl-CoA dehydrogenase [Micromonospora sp. WMMA1363]|uniref:acyl-CoA dehydrogenase n=1 Tax=Micromonospora sp. WMMA1363 TaxID=3053985 RepID=UPI00259D314F|nr:acyl-CoA dehydrogenase [Micromonospora sp. WMMA1363]MDM4719426.1 acyl-CoA dehydrogenase [Micromonospora sp. WMMA1363]
MPIATTADQLAVQDAIRRWAAGANILATVRTLENGPSSQADRHWPGLVDLGCFALAVPERLGGDGGRVSDLVAALEQITDALVPGPVMPTLLAVLALAPHERVPAARTLLPAMAAGDVSVGVALTPGTLTAVPVQGGALRVTGRVGAVLGGGATTHLLLAATTETDTVWFVLDTDHDGIRVTSRTPVDFSRPLADVRMVGAHVGPDQLLPSSGQARVRDVAALLGAVEAAAVAGWCLRAATDHAKVRYQFGRPIGSFQAVQHLCAGMLCRAERAAAVAWDAARAYDQAPEEFPLAAAAAAAIALDAGVDNAKDCIQVLGGIGFTWEHDAHLYLRRALAVRQLLGGGAGWRERCAELTLGGARRNLWTVDDEHRAPAATAAPSAAGSGTDAANRMAVRGRIRAIARLPEDERRAGLAAVGYLAPHWPAPYGIDASPAQQLLIDEELDRAGVARPDLTVGGWAVPTILRHGSTAQRDRFAGPSLRGEITWCQLFSEPEAGSDLAALRTRADRVTGGWRLSGQKVWTSLAAEADWAICLARTDPAAAKHQGLTYFLLDMRSPGIEIRPLREITGRSVFNEVFLDGVFVPDEGVVGEPGQGWRLARATLSYERVAMGRGPGFGADVERLVRMVGADGVVDEPGARERLGGHVADGLAVSLVDVRAMLRRLGGDRGGPESAVAKLIGVGHRQAVAETALSVCGSDGAAADGTSVEPVYQFLLTRCLSIAGGTTQILLSLVAERVLGLPKGEGS